MAKRHPPKLAERFLLFFLKEELAEEVLGDLDEKFFHTAKQQSLSKAKRNYWYQVINYLRPFAFKYLRSNSKLNTMIKHNFLISYRVMVKNKMQSIINIGGLALGMIVAILIALWLNDELTFNQNHATYDRVVQVLRKDIIDGDVYVNSSQVSKLGVHLSQTYPTIFEEVSTTFYRNRKQFLKVGELSLERLGYYFSVNAADLLALEFVAGQKLDATNLNSILLSEHLAKTFFPDENPKGQSDKEQPVAVLDKFWSPYSSPFPSH